MTAANLSLALTPRLGLQVSPALLAFTEVLALPLAELEELVERELAANPALERLDGPACPGCGRPLTDWDCPACGDGTSRWPGGRPGMEDDDGTVVPHRLSAAELLEAEAGPLVPTRDRWLVSYLVAELDDRGLLGRHGVQLAAELGVDPARVAGALDAVRAVGPPGVGALDVQDCLLRQLEPFEARGEAPPLVRPMIAGHLDDLASGRVGVIAAALGASEADVEAAHEFLRRRLRPSAAPAEPADLPVPPPPDVVIRADPGDPERFQVEVVQTARASTRLDPAWMALAQAGRRQGTLSGAEHRRMLADAARARAFLSRLLERSATLARIAGHVAERQRRFLRHGPIAHAPLTRAEVAADLGIHQSTVSRAIAGKRVRLPDGRVVAFAELFGSARSVQEQLLAVVGAEERPLSDGELAAELRTRGYAVARRTVAKYRGQLGIPPRARR
jgi:RNA polymerase sigma-54 factor